MDRSELYKVVRDSLLVELARTGNKNVPVSIMNHHVHLSRTDAVRLFGADYQLTKSREMSQPGQFACEEKISLIGPKGTISDVRVVGPLCEQTRVEVSYTDTATLGIKPIIRLPGSLPRSLLGTPGIKLGGPAGTSQLHSGVIVPVCHLHLSVEEASAYGLKDGGTVGIRRTAQSNETISNVCVCTGSGQRLEVHINADEAAAANIRCGEILEII